MDRFTSGGPAMVLVMRKDMRFGSWKVIRLLSHPERGLNLTLVVPRGAVGIRSTTADDGQAGVGVCICTITKWIKGHFSRNRMRGGAWVGHQ